MWSRVLESATQRPANSARNRGPRQRHPATRSREHKRLVHFQDPRSALAAADAHGDHGVAAAATLHLVNGGGG